MSVTCPDLSGSLPPETIAALRAIDAAARAENVHFFIVGATARDIILEHQHRLSTARATLDVDVAVMVDTWEIYDTLKQKLIDSYVFSQDPKQRQRVWHRGTIPLDIIPFGPIADPDDAITWPPSHDTRMRTIGFRECFERATPVKIAESPDFVVIVVGLAGLALLKLISWNDSPDRRIKDAQDLFLICRNYIDAGNLDRVLGEEMDAIAVSDNDYELASAYLLGRDIAGISGPSTLAAILEILDREASAGGRSPHSPRRDAQRPSERESIRTHFTIFQDVVHRTDR